MGVHEDRGVLAKALKQLEHQWVDTKMNWSDSRSHDFEEKYLISLAADLRSAVSAMDQVAVLLHKIQQDCE